MTINRRLDDVHVEIEFDIHWWEYDRRDPTSKEKLLERKVSDFEDFLRDHRSQDMARMYIIQEYSWQCSYCGWVYSTKPTKHTVDCCEEAINELAAPLLAGEDD